MTLEYRGKTLQEMDLDAVLRRKPSLVLVDELAHTNAPGARNRKRYQDVLELIDHGIDVFTTVNVQHLEGFADTVEEITGITIAERIPDSVFDAADQVVLIDLSPEELLKRLAEGKVYLGERAQAAADNFFKKSTLDRPAGDGAAPHGAPGHPPARETTPRSTASRRRGLRRAPPGGNQPEPELRAPHPLDPAAGVQPQGGMDGAVRGDRRRRWATPPRSRCART